MSEEIAADVPVDETPTETTIDQSIDTPADSLNDDIFNEMIPLFKKLNYDEDKARSVLSKVSSGMDFENLTNEEGLVFGKYKDISAAQDAFKTLESENGRLRREKSPEAPEEYSYDFSTSDDMKDIIPEGFDIKEDPLMQAMAPVFKDANVSQEQMQNIIKGWLSFEQSMVPVQEEEMAKLGQDANKIVSEVQSFVKKNFNESEQQRLEAMAVTADDTRLLHKMAKIMAGTKSIPSGDSESFSGESSAELYNKAWALKKKTDNFQFNMDAQREYDAILEKAIKVEEAGF